MAAQSTIVYADLLSGSLQSPSVVAESIAQAALESQASGQFDVILRALSADDIRRAIEGYPSGHERLAPDSNLVLLDAGAMLAYAPYRSRVLLTCDPFGDADEIGRTLLMDVDALRVRLHDALSSAHNVVALCREAFDAVAPLLTREPDAAAFPSKSLRGSEAASAPILVIGNEGERLTRQTLTALREAFPLEQFLPFDPVDVFEKAWKAVIHLGIAQSSVPGARLSDAWVGNVPVLQLVDPTVLGAQRRRRPGQLTKAVVEHGRNGLLASGVEELVSALGDVLLDAMPARVVARGAQRRVDPAAEWDALLRIVLQ